MKPLTGKPFICMRFCAHIYPVKKLTAVRCSDDSGFSAADFGTRLRAVQRSNCG